MLISLMYHHVNSDKFSNKLEVLEKHFKYISERYETISPLEYKPSLFKIQLCLVFDDAYYDFYYYVFELLKKYNLKALLAVPTNFILDTTALGSSERLKLSHSDMMEGDNYKKYSPFCTWQEMNEMVESKFVEVISHTHKHVRLAELPEDELDNELVQSKNIIESKLNTKCEGFAFPYCLYTDRIVMKPSHYYKYWFGCFGGMHYKMRNGFITRVAADEMVTGDELFSTRRILGGYKRVILNELLGKNPNS